MSKKAGFDVRKSQVNTFYRKFYTSLSEGNWKCNCCSKSYKQASGSGWSNLETHLLKCVPDADTKWKAFLQEGSLQASFFGEKVNNFCKVTNFFLRCNMPFSTLDLQEFKGLYPKEFMCSKTYKKYLELVADELRMVIKKELPDKFVLVFDGWKGTNDDHFVGIFACYSTKETGPCAVLLSLSEMIGEGFTAETHKNHILSVLAAYGKSIDNVLCVVGDNCNTNKALAVQLNVPLLGCYSHRLNLHVKKMIADKADLVKKVEDLMIALRTSTMLQKLEKYTELKPIRMNVKDGLLVMKC